MTGAATPTTATPMVKATWTADYKGTTTNFRLVMNDSPGGGSYTIETRSTDATNANAWTLFVQVATTTDDRTAIKLTPKVLAELLDSIFVT